MFSEVAHIFYPGDVPTVMPRVNDVSPTSGSSGTTITITGTGLSGTTKVTLGGVACTDLNVEYSNQVTAVTPSGPNKGARPLVLTVDGTDIPGPSFQVT
jgi:hypothetical protein